MRSVAQKLIKWADDLEASLQRQDAPKEEQAEEKPAAPEKKKKPAGQRPAAQPTEPEAPAESPLALPDVRALLAEKCAAGFSTQVKALIESYGASSLREVPAEHYRGLVEAAKALGGDADA